MTKVIADISGNHGGSLDKALNLIKAAAVCGCDYAKFQYYSPMLMPDQENRKLYNKLCVPQRWLEHLFMGANRVGISLFASVFDVEGVEHIEDWDVPFFKIASPESTRLENYGEIIGRIRRGTPIIFSSGEKDTDMFERSLLWSDILLYCPSGHPTPCAGFRELEFYRDHHFDGISDHCADLSNAKFFIDSGAEWVERHIKLDDDCVDSAFSSDPKEMAELCRLAHG